MDPVSLGIVVGTTVGGGILNMLAGDEEREREERRKRAAMAMLRENIIDPNELDLMLRNVNRLFNNRLINTLNTTALRSRGYANANVVKAAASGAMESSRLEQLVKVQDSVMAANRATRGQMAQVELGAGARGTSTGDFASGAFGGAQTGMELSKLFATEALPTDPIPTAETMKSSIPSVYDASNKPGLATLMGTQQSMATPYTNPLIGKLQITDDDIYGFSAIRRTW